MLQNKVVLGHSRDIASYSGADGLRVSVEREIVVVGPNHNLMFRPQKQVPPMHQHLYHCQEFLIIHIVVALHQVQGLQIVPYHLEFTPIISLVQDCPQHILRGVYLQLEWSVMVGTLQHGVTRDYCLESADGLGAFRCPYEAYILLGELLNQSNYVRVPLDERVVIPEQSQCASDVVHVIQHFLPCS